MMTNRKPRILSVFPGFVIGGAQVRFAAIVNHFGVEWQHVIVSLNGRLDCRERLVPGLDVSFADPGLIKGDTRGNLARIRRFLRETAPDVLITHNWGSMDWAMANALFPLVRHVHIEDGFGPEERSRQLPRRAWTRRIVLRRSHVVLPSQTLLTIARDIWKLPERRLTYIPNGIDPDRFTPAARIPTDAPIIGTVAALRPEKNIARLLHAFHLLRQTDSARLLIVGDGAQRGELQALAAKLGIADDVEFTGHQPDPLAQLQRFDIFALSSDTEQMPISVLEAMAMQLPVAATDVGDVRAMLAAENRGSVVPLSAEALAAALRDLVQIPAQRHQIGMANRSKIEADYTQTMMFAAYQKLFLGHG
ncbi:MAG: glycosyltransferase [Acetobacteraceae bacterium]|nr:glycosyltransferase [Acetobacteraceae bacterium]